MKKSFTFIEILVSAIILATSLAAILSTFVAVRKSVLRSARRLVCINVARDILDTLNTEVRQDTWGGSSNNLSAGSYTSSAYNNKQIGETKYTATYNVSDLSSATGSSADNYRKVTVTVSYKF